MRRSRGLLIAFVAAVVELLIVAGTGNQWVSKRIADNATGTRFPNVLARGAVGFPWRFNPQTDRTRIWAAELIGVGTLVVLVFLLTLILTARSSRSFFGTLVGTWGVTTVSALLAAGLRQWLAFPTIYPTGRDGNGYARLANAFLDGPSSTVVFFALASGLLTGIVAGAVASLTSRPVEVAATAPAAGAAVPAWSPETAPPWGADAPGDPSISRWSEQPSDPYRAPAWEAPTEVRDTEAGDAETGETAVRGGDAPTGQIDPAEYERRFPRDADPDEPQPGSTSELPSVSARERPRGGNVRPPETNGRS
jgi:hypothetical protein